TSAQVFRILRVLRVCRRQSAPSRDAAGVTDGPPRRSGRACFPSSGFAASRSRPLRVAVPLPCDPVAGRPRGGTVWSMKSLLLAAAVLAAAAALAGPATAATPRASLPDIEDEVMCP